MCYNDDNAVMTCSTVGGNCKLCQSIDYYQYHVKTLIALIRNLKTNKKKIKK